MGLGKIVGEPTAKGEDMESHPRPVDVPVSMPMRESHRGMDVQQETAVKRLLEQ